MKRTALMGLGMALGLAIGCAAAPFVIPPVRAGTNPQKWEYSCFDDFGAESVGSKANEMGAQGWEMAAAAGGKSTWCFKRPLP